MLGLRSRSGRRLTPGEVALARSVFGDALEVSRVRIHDRAYLPGQGRGVAMTPNGHVWFRPADHRPDFSLRAQDAAWLVHELVHAWQHQIGRHVRLRGFIEQASRLFGFDPYRYGVLDPTRPFDRLKLEQQAAVVEDWFRRSRGLSARFGSGTPDAYQRVIPFAPTKQRA